MHKGEKFIKILPEYKRNQSNDNAINIKWRVSHFPRISTTLVTLANRWTPPIWGNPSPTYQWTCYNITFHQSIQMGGMLNLPCSYKTFGWVGLFRWVVLQKRWEDFDGKRVVRVWRCRVLDSAQFPFSRSVDEDAPFAHRVVLQVTVVVEETKSTLNYDRQQLKLNEQ